MRTKKKLSASIIIPNYNSGKIIEETLDALNAQTIKEFEVIIVDDGSVDNSIDVIKKFDSRFPIKLIKQKNSGPAIARNNGAKNAKSDIILFLDSDCVPFPDFIEMMIKPFESKDIVGVHGMYETKNKHSFIARYIGYEMAYRQEPMKKAERIDHIATHAAAYRKKDFGNGFSEGFRKADMEDIEFSYRLAKAGKKLIFQPDAKIKHPHPESLKKFVKQQFGRGYWRVLGHMRHPDKLMNDSYLRNSILIQGILSVLFFILTFEYFLLLVFSGINLYYLPIIGLLLIYFSNMPLGIYCWRYEKKMILLAPAMAVVRSISASLGFIMGFIKIRIIGVDRQ